MQEKKTITLTFTQEEISLMFDLTLEECNKLVTAMRTSKNVAETYMQKIGKPELFTLMHKFANAE
jgi:flagellar motor switch protein FliG